MRTMHSGDEGRIEINSLWRDFVLTAGVNIWAIKERVRKSCSSLA